MNWGLENRESAKQRALRIPLDYLSRPDRFARLKLSLTLAAGLMAAVYVWYAASQPGAAITLSPGPLTSVHAPWEANCSACHPDFVAIRADSANWLARSGVAGIGGETPVEESLRTLIDRQCQACHAGSPHHPNELARDARACTSCHTDHNGRTERIARPDDIHCTRCHAGIADHRQPAGAGGRAHVDPPIGNVTRFAGQVEAGEAAAHPDFRSLASDPGNVKFNHHLHLTAGLPAADPSGQGRKLLTLADLPTDFVERYRTSDQPAGQKPDSEYAVQLNCASCHRFSSGDVSSRLPGALALPVEYARDCRACHPLNFEPAAGREIEHGLSPAAMRQWLMGRYQFELASGQLESPVIPWLPVRPIPGRGSDPVPTGEAGLVTGRVATAEQYLHSTGTCQKCHFEETAVDAGSGYLLRPLQRADIPTVWLRHARFDHAAHRSIDCAECHALAYPEPTGLAPHNSDRASRAGTGPRDQDVVMIAGQDVCLRCHAPRLSDGSRGTAQFDCVECHRYHAAGDPGSHR